MWHIISENKFLTQYIVGFIVAFMVSFLVMPAIIRLAKRRHWIDYPNHRKVHQFPVPTLGGIGVFAGILFSWFLMYNYLHSLTFLVFFVSLITLLITGIIDDLKNISVSIRFIVQIAIAVAMAYSGLRVTNLHNLFGIGELPLFWQYLLTVVLLVGITNSFNFIDGIDGLAGGIGLINSLMFAVIFSVINEMVYCFIALSLAGSLLAYLYYNFYPARIFMGDSGSLVIGFILAVLAVTAVEHPSFNPDSYMVLPNIFVLVTATLLVPVFDTIRVFIARLLRGQSPFKADKTHIHHLIVKTGYNHKKAAIILYITNIVLIVFVFAIQKIRPEIALILLVITALLFMEFLTLRRIVLIGFYIKKIKSEKEKLRKENRFLVEKKKQSKYRKASNPD